MLYQFLWRGYTCIHRISWAWFIFIRNTLPLVLSTMCESFIPLPVMTILLGEVPVSLVLGKFLCQWTKQDWDLMWPLITYTLKTQGRPQDLGGGGGQEFSDLGICMSRSDMLRMAKPCALLGGFGGMLPRENFLKRCNLVRFRVYFDQIFSFIFFKKCHFLYKK